MNCKKKTAMGRVVFILLLSLCLSSCKVSFVFGKTSIVTDSGPVQSNGDLSSDFDILASSELGMESGSGEEQQEYPYYYEDHLRSKLYTLRKINKQNDIVYSFAFLTDLHWISNAQHSPELVKYINNEIGINKTVLGGDYINFDYDEVETPKSIMRECVNSFSFGDYTAIVGNHDSNWNSGGNTPRISDTEIFSIINNATFSHPYTSELDYTNNICSLYLNTGIGSFNDQGQKDFIFNTLSALDDTWHVILFVHIIFDGSYHEDNLSVIRPAGEAFLDYFDSIKESLSCNFVGVFSGHSHLDYLNTIDYCFPVVTTMCDSIGTYTPAYNIYLRDANTYTEQAFDVVQIDTTKRKVFLTRIGCGVDRTFLY